MQKRAIIKGTLILTAAGLIARVLGFVNRIYLSNVIGAEGIGLYQLIFPIYMICYTICCSGIFTAISRLTAEEKSKTNHLNAKKMLHVAISISLSLSLALTLLVFFGADFISNQIIKEPRIAMGLKIISLAIPFVAITHSIKAYFYGLNKPAIPATTQVIEQIVRISIIYMLAATFIQKGLSYACAVAVFGMAIGEITSCVIVCLFYIKGKEKVTSKQATPSSLFYFKKITRIAIPLTSNRLITTLLLSLETILLPARLKLFGYSHDYALSIFGTLTGMALPLILFPTVVTTSASLLLLPAISEAHSNQETKKIDRTVTQTIRLSLLIGIVFMFYFLAYGKNLGMAIYHEPYVGELLVALSICCPFLYLQTTLGSLLNGLDFHMITFRNNVIGLALRISFVFFLIPQIGLKGYLIGFIASLLLVSILDIIHLIQSTSVHFRSGLFIFLPCICCGGAIAIQFFLQRLHLLSLGATLELFIQSGLYFSIVLLLLLMTKCIRTNDFKL